MTAPAPPAIVAGLKDEGESGREGEGGEGGSIFFFPRIGTQLRFQERLVCQFLGKLATAAADGRCLPSAG